MFKRTVTRVALDDRRHVSADGQLFSLQVGEPYADADRTPLKFIGYLLVPETGEEMNFSVRDEAVRIGKHITVGLGKMRFEAERVETEAFPKARIASWQEVSEDTSVPLMINGTLPLSMASVQVEEYDDIDAYCQAYAEWLKESAKAPSDIRVSFAYTQQTVRRNFQNGAMARQEQLTKYLLPGSILVVDAPNQQTLQQWLEQIHTDGIHVAPHTSTITIAPDFCLRGGTL